MMHLKRYPSIAVLYRQPVATLGNESSKEKIRLMLT
jgi:hypothetical protein